MKSDGNNKKSVENNLMIDSPAIFIEKKNVEDKKPENDYLILINRN